MQNNNAIQSIGKDNQPIIDALTRVRKVSVQLCHQGFRVIDINIGKRNPVIIINPANRCAALEGTPIKRARLQNCLVITYVVNIEGVQVEWTVPDHG